jgi:hypothetical protein
MTQVILSQTGINPQVIKIKQVIRIDTGENTGIYIVV